MRSCLPVITTPHDTSQSLCYIYIVNFRSGRRCTQYDIISPIAHCASYGPILIKLLSLFFKICYNKLLSCWSRFASILKNNLSFFKQRLKSVIHKPCGSLPVKYKCMSYRWCQFKSIYFAQTILWYTRCYIQHVQIYTI